jgi:hypothetical protein
MMKDDEKRMKEEERERERANPLVLFVATCLKNPISYKWLDSFLLYEWYHGIA